MTSTPVEKLLEELSSDLQDLLVREAFVRRRRQLAAAALTAQRAQETELAGTRPAFLMFRRDAKEELSTRTARLREEIGATERTLQSCEVILQKCHRIVAKELEGYLAQRSTEFRNLQSARQLLPEWQNAVGLYRSCLKRFITSLGVARNQMSSGYDRRTGKFATGSIEAFATAATAARTLESEATIPNNLAKRQRLLLGLDPNTIVPAPQSAALPYMLGPGLAKQVTTFATSSLEVTARAIGGLIDDCERHYPEYDSALPAKIAHLEALLHAQWEQVVAAPLAEIRQLADSAVDELQLSTVFEQMEKRFVSLTG